MTPITRAQRFTDHQLYLELLQFIDSAELSDDELAVIEEAAQRLASKVPYDNHRFTLQALHPRPSGLLRIQTPKDPEAGRVLHPSDNSKRD